MGESPAKLGLLERITLVDSQKPSPAERAKYILAQLEKLDPKPTEWDILCFCAERLGAFAIENEVFRESVGHMMNLLYLRHYYFPDDLPSCLLKTSVSEVITQSPQTGPTEQ